MPRYNVKRPTDNKWACFSTIIDDFLTQFMDFDQYKLWRENEYPGNCSDLQDSNIMPYDEAILRQAEANKFE